MVTVDGMRVVMVLPLLLVACGGGKQPAPNAAVTETKTAAAEPLPCDGSDDGHPRFLQGCWRGEDDEGREVVEKWGPNKDGGLVGDNRTLGPDGEVVHRESLKIEPTDDGFTYRAHPTGQQATTFTATKLGATCAHFENPEHDYPQRISYRAEGNDALVARIDGVRQKGPASGEWRFSRFDCPLNP